MTSDVKFTGTWTFAKNAVTINHIPTITAGDKTITVGDSFDPKKDVTASDKKMAVSQIGSKLSTIL